MKYYFDPELGVRAFEADGSQDFLITKEMRPLTESEVNEHLNPAPTPEQLSNTERAWRDVELGRADIELNKVQDGVGTGTVGAWREYRCALRDWPEHPDFPRADKRPVAPDAKTS